MSGAPRVISGTGGGASPTGYWWCHSVVETPAAGKRIRMSAEAREKMRRNAKQVKAWNVML
jgi:hypothetical protein